MATVANIKVQIFSILFKSKTQNSKKKKKKKKNRKPLGQKIQNIPNAAYRWHRGPSDIQVIYSLRIHELQTRNTVVSALMFMSHSNSFNTETYKPWN